MSAVIVIPVMFAAFSVYKFCTYGVMEDLHSYQTLTKSSGRNVVHVSTQKSHENMTNDDESDEPKPVGSGSPGVPRVQHPADKGSTLQFQASALTDETRETLKNLNVLIKDLSEHNDALRRERDALKSRLNESDTHAEVFQTWITDLKQQNAGLRTHLDELVTIRAGLETLSDRLRRQRDEVAGVLNNAMRNYGQQNCDFLQYKQKAGEEVWLWVTETGGYCLKDRPPHYWDKGLTEAISNFLANKSVMSLGEGPAYYQSEILALGEVANFTSYDGSPFYEVGGGGGGKVSYLDLSVPQYGLPGADWVLCIEVGQHVPRRWERVVVDNLVRHAREGVIVSWSSHGQGGYSQPNPRSQGYIIELFDEHDFRQNSEESKVLKDSPKAGWLKRNIMVFRRKNLETFDPNST